MLELSGWAAVPMAANGIIKFGSDLVLYMEMQSIGTEPRKSSLLIKLLLSV